MGTKPTIFRDAYHNCRWIFDLFAHGFDFLNGRFIPPPDDGQDQRWSLEACEIDRRNIIAHIVRADGAIPDEVRQYLDLPGGDAGIEAPEFCLRLFSTLTAIDRAAADLNYLGVRTRQTHIRWPQVTEHFERNGKQLQWQATGYVVFRPRYLQQPPSQAWWHRARESGRWKEMPVRGEHLQSYFENLIRVPDYGDCEFSFRTLSPSQDFGDLDWSSLRLGVVPLVEELRIRTSDAELLPGPLLLTQETPRPSTFGIRIAGNPEETCRELCNRAEAGLCYLAEKGCQIVLFPEMVVPDQVVSHLKQVLYRLTDAKLPRPGLVLAGTFTRMVPRYSQTKPFNVAVVLNHRGEELWRQRKTQPYDMKRHEQQIFGLEPILNSDSCREHIEFSPRKLRFVDSPATGLRMVVLVCEDATRDPGLRGVREFLPTLILTPVMAGPLKGSTGFAGRVDDVLQQAPGIFVVANSAALARAAWKGETGSPPLLIVGLPLVNVSQAYKAFEIVSQLETAPGPPAVQVLIFQFPS